MRDTNTVGVFATQFRICVWVCAGAGVGQCTRRSWRAREDRG